MTMTSTLFAHRDAVAIAVRRGFYPARGLFLFCCVAFVASPLLQVAQAQEATIKRLTIGDLGSDTDYRKSLGFAITPWRSQFFRTDGVVYPWGAGVTSIGRFQLISASIVGSRLRYEFDATSAEHLTEYTDFSFGDYGSTGTLVPAGPLVVTANIGSSVAVLSSSALIAANGRGYDPPRGALYSAPIGSIVPFSVSYGLIGGTWSLNTFDGNFSYRTTGAFEFLPVPEPSSSAGLLVGVGMLLLGRKRKQN